MKWLYLTKQFSPKRYLKIQTFLPYSSFYLSVKCLDKKRCWKQCLEAHQIINTITGKSEGWKNHPCIRMWRSYESSLTEYYNVFWLHCVNVHKIKVNKLQLKPSYEKIVYPPWLNNEYFLASHRSNLLRKDKEFYSQFGWTEPDDLPYVWPVDKEGILCISN